MSNTAVGAIYKKIIDAVVEASKTDFEENGVANDVLLALQEDWQHRLSATQRASFPWDPQPEPQSVTAALKAESISNAATVPSLPNQPNPATVHIKQETYDSSFLNLPQTPPYASGLNQPQYAHQRAAHLLQKQFGNQATGSIGALQAAQAGLPSAQPRTQGVQQRALQPPPKAESPYIKQENGQDSLGFAQTDGASGDRSETKFLHESLSDGTLRQQLGMMSQRIEAGGLLLPLEERPRPPKVPGQSRSRNIRINTMPVSAIPAPPHATEQAGPSTTPARYDGPDDDVADDDVINSDLDDSDDDELEGTIETDFKGDVILCLYDKVQRVKNKWKCTLKDGVVTVDGKDYVFHKAQGEFEW